MTTEEYFQKLKELGSPADCGMLAHCGQCLVKETLKKEKPKCECDCITWDPSEGFWCTECFSILPDEKVKKEHPDYYQEIVEWIFLTKK